MYEVDDIWANFFGEVQHVLDRETGSLTGPQVRYALKRAHAVLKAMIQGVVRGREIFTVLPLLRQGMHRSQKKSRN